MVSFKRALPQVNTLVVFEAAARHGNLTLAGAELCIAGSAVSRHVANLERATGLVLFIRTGNRLELTPVGRRLADAIAVGLGHVRDVLGTLQHRESNRTVTIACTYDLAQLWLMPRFRRLSELMPERQLRVITAESYDNFDSADIDLSIRFGDGNWPGFTVLHLFDEQCFPICAPALLERHPELLNASPEVLMRFPLLRMFTEDTMGLKWVDWLRDQGAKCPVANGPVFSTFSLLLLELVAARGIALGYVNVVDELLLDRRIVRLSDRSVRSGLACYLVCRDSGTIPIQSIVNLFRESVANNGIAGSFA